MSISTILLAAGKGTRMYANRPKVLQPLGGRPILRHLLETVAKLNPTQTVIVYGFGGEQVPEAFEDSNLDWVCQKNLCGTGEAVKQAFPSLKSTEQVLILCGDIPLLSFGTLEKLIKTTPKAALGLVTAKTPAPAGLGRVVRKNKNTVVKIVEEKDASDVEKAINEINVGVFLVPKYKLGVWLDRITPNNNQSEYYLTELVALAVADQTVLHTVPPEDLFEIQGVNTQRQLARLERIYQQQQAEKLMAQGVKLYDPARLDLRIHALQIGKDLEIDINVILEGSINIGHQTKIGANCILKNVIIGDNVEILPNSIIDGAKIQSGSVIGPFARIRPETTILDNSKVGSFVEMKKTILGPNSKANHLSYVGDAIIGEKVNIGAGTITCNYDGVNKHQTIIEDNVLIGSNTQLVAPVCVKKGATIGAGTTLIEDAPSDKLTVNKKEQIVVENWQRADKKI